jgi:hypothetical protein
VKQGFSRAEEIIARTHLAMPDAFAQAILDKKWNEVATTVSFAQADVPCELAATDPALYQELRNNITRFYLRGGAALDLNKIRALAANSPALTP